MTSGTIVADDDKMVVVFSDTNLPGPAGPSGADGQAGAPGGNFTQAEMTTLVNQILATPSAQTSLSKVFQNKATELSLFSIADEGAKLDGVELSNTSITAGTNTPNCPGYTFTNADIGKVIGFLGAGYFSTDMSTNANDGVLLSTITGVSGGNPIIADNAVNTLSSGVCVFGTADDVAIAAAQTKAAVRGGKVFIPPGRTIVTQSLLAKDFVHWVGAGREISWVEVMIKAAGNAADGSGSAADCSWLYVTGRGPTNPITGVEIHDFGVNARFHHRPGGYTAAIKPLNFFWVRRAEIYNMNVWNTPATSIPFDDQVESGLIAYNIIKNPGRLSAGTGGSSGVGIGTKNQGLFEPGLVIGNTILGVGSRTVVAKGINGIFLEGQKDSDITTATCGYRIQSNFIQGMPNGISDEGSQGTIVTGNTMYQCNVGLRISRGLVGGSYTALDGLYSNNSIVDTIYGPGGALLTEQGIGIMVSTLYSPVGAAARSLITSNNIIGSEGQGIRIITATTSIDYLVLNGNKIRGCQRSAIYFYSGSGSPPVNNITIINNQISACGLAAVSNDAHGIYVASPLVNPTIMNNNVHSDTQAFRLSSLGSMTGGGEVAFNNFDGNPLGLSQSVTLDVNPDASVRIHDNQGWTNALADSDILFIPAPLFDPVFGTTLPSKGGANAGRVPTWVLPDTITSAVGTVIAIPGDWYTWDIQAVVMTSDTDTSLNLSLQVDATPFLGGAPSAGALAASPSAPSAAVSTAVPSTTALTPTVKNMKTVQRSDQSYPTATTTYATAAQFWSINFRRNGGSAGDTASNCQFLGLRLIRRS